MTPATATIDHAAILTWIRRFAAEVADHREELVRLDTAIGDGDHGTNLDRGMRKAVEQLDADSGDPGDLGAVLKRVGMALVSSVGGAAGPLYGTLFLQMGSAAAGAASLDTERWAAAVQAGLDGVIKRGRAEPGDKTMVDALQPAADALRAAAAEGADPAEAARRAAAAAEDGMKATVPMEARKGRASYLGPRSAGHQDPGATSSYLLLRSAAEAFGSI